MHFVLMAVKKGTLALWIYYK